MPKLSLRKFLIAAIIVLSALYFIWGVLLPKAPPLTRDMLSEEDLQLHFIDVGQGDCILLTHRGMSALIDTGTAQYADQVIQYLNNEGIKTLDLAVATHPHADHMGGMAQIIRTFMPRAFWLPEATNDTAAFESMLLALDETGTPAQYAYTGDTFTLGGATIRVLSPDEGYESDNLNNYSIVLDVEFQGLHTLLMGDAEGEIESRMLDQGLVPEGIHVLKVGHHGSNTSSTDAFLKRAYPLYAVIQAGSGNSYGHPTQKVLERLTAIEAKIYRTDRDGTVLIAFSEEGEVYAFTETGE